MLVAVWCTTMARRSLATSGDPLHFQPMSLVAQAERGRMNVPVVLEAAVERGTQAPQSLDPVGLRFDVEADHVDVVDGAVQRGDLDVGGAVADPDRTHAGSGVGSPVGRIVG